MSMTEMAANPTPVPPHDREAEAAVLGGILINNDTYPTAAARVEPEHFYRPSHRAIFAVMATLHGRGEPIDLVTVKAALGDQIADVGGVSALARLVDNRPRGQNVGAYAEIVRRRAE